MKYRKGELTFYKSSTPKELKEIIKMDTENKKYVDQFLKEFKYNYVAKKWNKI